MLEPPVLSAMLSSQPLPRARHQLTLARPPRVTGTAVPATPPQRRRHSPLPGPPPVGETRAWAEGGPPAQSRRSARHFGQLWPPRMGGTCTANQQSGVAHPLRRAGLPRRKSRPSRGPLCPFGPPHAGGTFSSGSARGPCSSGGTGPLTRATASPARRQGTLAAVCELAKPDTRGLDARGSESIC